MTPAPRARDGSDRRSGASLVVTVVFLLGVLGVMALAVDLGMLFTARSEAQRTADAAALAGASAFQDEDAALAAVDAPGRALAYAEKNYIRGQMVKQNEVTVQVKSDSALVRVWVRRDSLPTWFARLIGFPFVPVGAEAAARALPGGSTRCLKPFAVPDVWEDLDNDTNGNNIWDPGENWQFDPNVDIYKPYTGGDGEGETGYGSALRNGASDASGYAYTRDFGREIQIKYTDPNSEFSLTPSMFLPWRIPEDPNIAQCSNGGGTGGSTGGAVYRQNICSCNSSSVVLGQPYDIEPGNMVGPTYQGIGDLINQDPNASWDPNTNTVVNSKWGDAWMDSPRVVKVALFDPTQVVKSGMQSITFNNFGLMFVEAQNSPQDPVVGRFLFYVPGDGQATGGPTGSLVLVLRLVE